MSMSHSHNSDTEKHPKQDFQVERLAFFSDAVFAIAITLLIIEFKVPHITKESSYMEVMEQLSELKISFVALLLTYFLIATYWMRHHFLYKYIHDYNKSLVVVNTAALLPIIFLPFTTAFFAECAENKNTFVLGWQVFFINHFAANLTIFALYWLAMVRHKHMSYEVPVKEKIKFYEQTLFSSVIFLVLFIVSLYTQDAQTITFALVGCVAVRAAGISVLKKKFNDASVSSAS